MEAAALPQFDPSSAGAPVRPGRRARGLVPHNLRQRLQDQGLGHLEVMHAGWIAQELDGQHPARVPLPKLAEWRTNFGEQTVNDALAALERAGYGQPIARAARPVRHGYRREARLREVLGKLPRAIALRMPTSADTDRSGPNDGGDVWGPVRCSMTLRADHLAIVAAAGGLWTARSRAGETFVECNRSELAALIWPRKKFSGSELDRIDELLIDLEALELSAKVDNTRSKLGEPPSPDHVIPSTPIAAVERYTGDGFVPIAEYAQAVADAPSDQLRRVLYSDDFPAGVSLRIHLADWMLAELRHQKRRPTFINFRVWRHLRPTERRIYALTQAATVVGGDVRFYLAPPLLYTLGIRDSQRGRARSLVAGALANLHKADNRYRGGYGPAEMQNGYAGFAVHVSGNSEPTIRATAGRSTPRCPGRLRRLPVLRMTAEEIRAEVQQTAAANRAAVERAQAAALDHAQHERDRGPRRMHVALARAGLADGDDGAGSA